MTFIESSKHMFERLLMQLLQIREYRLKRILTYGHFRMTPAIPTFKVVFQVQHPLAVYLLGLQ